MPSVPCLSLPWLDMPGDTHTNGQSICHHPVANLVVSLLGFSVQAASARRLHRIASEGLFFLFSLAH